MKHRNIFIGKTLASFLLVLFTMPLGHALMVVMENVMSPAVLHCSAFLMGALGFAVTVWGVFVKGDTRQTICGLAGGLLFWTGWVEFLMAYYAQRYGTHCDLTGDGTVTTITHYVHSVVGCQHPHGHRYGHCLLDIRGGHGAQQVPQRNMGGSYGTPCGDVEHPPLVPCSHCLFAHKEQIKQAYMKHSFA